MNALGSTLPFNESSNVSSGKGGPTRDGSWNIIQWKINEWHNGSHIERKRVRVNEQVVRRRRRRKGNPLSRSPYKKIRQCAERMSHTLTKKIDCICKTDQQVTHAPTQSLGKISMFFSFTPHSMGGWDYNGWKVRNCTAFTNSFLTRDYDNANIKKLIPFSRNNGQKSFSQLLINRFNPIFW